MAEDPLEMSFHSSQDPGPDDKDHLMHLAFASSRAIYGLVLYGIVVGLTIILLSSLLVPDVIGFPVSRCG